MIVLSRAEVRSLLDPVALIDALAPAMAALSAGNVAMPARTMVPAGSGLLASMPAFASADGTLGAKLVTVFPDNPRRDLEGHHALIALFDAGTGVPVAVMDGAEITALRTAAGSALSTRLLAREDATVLAVLGTGVQARSHARVVPLVRPISEIRVAGRDRAKAEALAAEVGPPAVAVDSFEAAVRGADVVCATTHAQEPVVHRPSLSAGVHVTSVGFTAGAEVDADTVADARVVVETRAAALGVFPDGASDLAWALRDGRLRAEDVAEIGEVVAGTRPGRGSDDEITYYRSVGVAAQDLVAARLVLEAARTAGSGTEVAL